MTQQRGWETSPLAAEVQDVWKSYGGTPVLKRVSLDVREGEIHALVGGNGAGKSTLMKALTGVVTPDEGTIRIAGREVRRLNPHSAHANRIYMVPQEPQLFPDLSVLENILLCLEDIKIEKAKVQQVCASMAPHIDLNVSASELSLADQQLVEICRGILRDSRVLIFDEPTAALSVHEVNSLFRHLRVLSDQGVAMFYVTHRLDEVFELCDRVTVLRDGQIALQRRTDEISLREIVAEMVATSFETSETAYQAPAKAEDSSQVLLDVSDFSGQGFRDVRFHVRQGEIVGIAGVVGSGRTELAESIYGLRAATGAVTLIGKPFDRRSPRASLARGLSYVPEDRNLNGLFALGDVIDNVDSTVLQRMSSWGWLHPRQERARVNQLVAKLALQPGPLSRRIGNLSGGNQQKVAVAKQLNPEPRVIILDEPTRGVDVGARADLYRSIRVMAQQGTGIIIISSDFEEIAEVCTRVLIMRNGELAHELATKAISFQAVRDGCFGVEPQGSQR